ncbi:hypothetical protein PV326_011407 [Microctonus aethiopoides]|nr:hypothetical protein PV326_011407 [Microctonus aethiopoides]
MKMLKINSSMDTIKSIDRGVSKYWGDLLRYHWPIAIQSFFLVIIILTFGPWIGLRCNDNIPIDDNTNDHSSSWWPLIGYTETSKSPMTITRETCTYGYFCSTKNSQSGESVRRKASFLKRKRYLKDLID